MHASETDLFETTNNAINGLFQAIVSQIMSARGDQADTFASSLLVMFLAGARSAVVSPEWAIGVLRELRDTGAVAGDTLDKFVRDFVAAVPVARIEPLAV